MVSLSITMSPFQVAIDYKRSMKVAELTYNEDGTIQTIDP